MNREVRAHGKVLFVATLSSGMQVHPDRGERSAFTKRLEVTDLLYPDRRIIDLARTQRIPSWMLVPELLDWRNEMPPACMDSRTPHRAVVTGINRDTGWQAKYSRGKSVLRC